MRKISNIADAAFSKDCAVDQPDICVLLRVQDYGELCHDNLMYLPAFRVLEGSLTATSD